MSRIRFQHFLLIFIYLTSISCTHIGTSNSSQDNAVVEEVAPLPDSALSSVQNMEFVVDVIDSVHSGKLSSLNDPFVSDSAICTFRGNLYRDASYGGTVTGKPSRIVRDWLFETEEDFTQTSLGVWRGGMGWTGQPLFVVWPDSLIAQFKQRSTALTADFGKREVIAASLFGSVYFINFDTGKASRLPLPVGNPIKGTPALDPSFNGNLYAGHGIPRSEPVGQTINNLFSHKQIQPGKRDPNALRGWPTSDSSPIVVGGFLIWPSENGGIYKYLVGDDGNVSLHSVLRYHIKGTNRAPGIESSMSVYRNYGYVGDNHGNILCVDLNTLHPIWLYDNKDDIDATPVIEVEDEVPYVYVASEMDRQGDEGLCHIVKLNGLTGVPVWEHPIACNKQILNGKHFDGGVYGTPLLGKGNCKNLIFMNVCQIDDSRVACFCAFDRHTGREVYRTPLKYFAWNSPVAFYNERDELFVFTGDSAGFGYLIDGATGEILFSQLLANNFESSAAVIGNSFVIGSRGKEIYRFSIY